MAILFILLSLAGAVYGVWYFVAHSREERAKALLRPFPSEWERILHRNVPLTRLLDEDQLEHLKELVKAFLIDIEFEGAGGLDVDDEIRLTIASQACLLVVGNHRRFPRLRSVVVYPSTYQRELDSQEGLVSEQHQDLLGESWEEGYVVLAWDAVLEDSLHTDGRNVVLHEFAHQLDQEDGEADGIPIPAHPVHYAEWAEIMERDLDRLRELIDQDQPTDLDEYGAMNRAEFFAVASETFFEQPQALQRHSPELYELLRSFYRLEPL